MTLDVEWEVKPNSEIGELHVDIYIILGSQGTLMSV